MNARFAALVFLLAAAGCADNRASIEIFGLCGFPDDAEECVTNGTCDTIIAQRPVVFTRAPDRPISNPVNSFDVFIQLNNQLPNNANKALGRVNTNDFTITEYELSYSSSGFSIPDAVFKDTAVVPASSSFTPLVKLIPEGVMAAIAAAMPDNTEAVVEVELVVVGELQDGSTIEAGPLVVPIDVVDNVAPAAGTLVCPDSTQVVVAACPHHGQTASVKCEAPTAP